VNSRVSSTSGQDQFLELLAADEQFDVHRLLVVVQEDLLFGDHDLGVRILGQLALHLFGDPHELLEAQGILGVLEVQIQAVALLQLVQDPVAEGPVEVESPQVRHTVTGDEADESGFFLLEDRGVEGAATQVVAEDGGARRRVLVQSVGHGGRHGFLHQIHHRQADALGSFPGALLGRLDEAIRDGDDHILDLFTAGGAGLIHQELQDVGGDLLGSDHLLTQLGREIRSHVLLDEGDGLGLHTHALLGQMAHDDLARHPAHHRRCGGAAVLIDDDLNSGDVLARAGQGDTAVGRPQIDTRNLAHVCSLNGRARSRARPKR
jgi:hypothetical protein